MGHFSRYIPPGSRRVGLKNLVEPTVPVLQPGDVKNGQPLLFAPCDGSGVQTWMIKDDGTFTIPGTNEAESSDGYQVGGECMDASIDSWIEGLVQTWKCAPTTTPQQFTVVPVAGGSQIYHEGTGTCLTAVQTTGNAVGLDQGVTIVAAQLKACKEQGAAEQTFTLSNADRQGFPTNFPVRTQAAAPGGGEL